VTATSAGLHGLARRNDTAAVSAYVRGLRDAHGTPPSPTRLSESAESAGWGLKSGRVEIPVHQGVGLVLDPDGRR